MDAQPLPIVLDRSSPVPLYHQVSSIIERHIDSGGLRPGSFLENENDLAARLGISRPTARHALQQLVDKGRLVRKRGVGTRVAPERFRRSLELTSLHSELSHAGRRPSTQILACETVAACEELAAQLEIATGTEVVQVRRLRLADGEPLALMTNALRTDVAPSEAELATRGLYESLRARGFRLSVAEQKIGARSASPAEAELLGEEPGAALLTMERTAYDESGVALEHGRHLYRPTRYIFDTTVMMR